LSVGVNAALVFVEYDRSPEARYPVAIEQGYATARWIMQHGAAESLDTTRLAVAGDSVGGNMAAALAILAARRQGVLCGPEPSARRSRCRRQVTVPGPPGCAIGWDHDKPC
jgi:acetyl esterase/lipase